MDLPPLNWLEQLLLILWIGVWLYKLSALLATVVTSAVFYVREHHSHKEH